jgi:hypothetical protein
MAGMYPRALGRPLRRGALPAPGGWWQRRRRIVVLVAVVMGAGFLAATGLLLVWPQQGAPARVDAIVMLNGPGDRLGTALNLGWQHRAPVLVISRGSRYWGHGSVCAPKMPGVRVICFDPSPATTQGEAQFIGRLAATYQWKTVALVTITPQITPGRIWLGRCLPPGTRVYAVAAPLRAAAWPPMAAYEWGSIINAELFHRSCY